MKKQNPRPLAGGAGAEKTPSIGKRCDSPSKCSLSKAEFWLHVATDGTEYRYDYEPCDVRSLHVVVEAGFETTITRNIRSFEGVRCNPVGVRPRGLGWDIIDSNSDNFTVWRRRVVAS